MSAIGDLVSDTWKDMSGRTARDGIKDAQRALVGAGENAIGTYQNSMDETLGYYDGYSALGDRGIGMSGFLGDPQAQFDFLQSNPLFELALNNANQQTNSMGAAKGRLSAGDTLQQLSNNVLLSATPLLNQQRNDIGNMINTGMGAQNQMAGLNTLLSGRIADTQMGIGNAQAQGLMGFANAQGQIGQNDFDFWYGKAEDAAKAMFGMPPSGGGLGGGGSGGGGGFGGGW